MKKIFSFFLLFFSLTISAQELGVSGGFSYLKTTRGSDYLMEKNKPWYGGRFEFTSLTKNETGVYSRYASLAIEYYNPIRDSVNVLFDQSFNSKKGVKYNYFFNIAGRYGFAIPQNISDFLMINAGFGFGINAQRTHFKIDSIGKDDQIAYYQPKGAALPFTSNLRPGETSSTIYGAYPEIFAGFFYEFEHFSLYGNVALRFILDKDLDYQFQHNISIGIFYPFKKS